MGAWFSCRFWESPPPHTQGFVLKYLDEILFPHSLSPAAQTSHRHVTSASQSVGAVTAFGSSCQHRLVDHYSPVHCSEESPQLMLPTSNPPVIQSKEASTWHLWTWRERWAVDSPRVKARAGGACVKHSWENYLDREICPGCDMGKSHWGMRP